MASLPSEPVCGLVYPAALAARPPAPSVGLRSPCQHLPGPGSPGGCWPSTIALLLTQLLIFRRVGRDGRRGEKQRRHFTPVGLICSWPERPCACAHARARTHTLEMLGVPIPWKPKPYWNHTTPQAAAPQRPTHERTPRLSFQCQPRSSVLTKASVSQGSGHLSSNAHHSPCPTVVMFPGPW